MTKLVKSKVANCDLEGPQTNTIDLVSQQIFIVRGQRVMLDRDLAALYGVTTKRLNQQLRRNRKRFPADFTFQLTLIEAKEITSSRLQNATLKKGENIKHAPNVFTEHGAIMIASVLNTPVAVQASIYVVRAFVQMRTALVEFAELSRRMDQLEATFDERFQEVFKAIRTLMLPAAGTKRPIGFVRLSRRSRVKEDH